FSPRFLSTIFMHSSCHIPGVRVCLSPNEAKDAMPFQHVTDIAKLKDICRQMRIEIVEMIGAAASGHPGGSLSEVELLAALYFGVMNHDPKNYDWPLRDRFIRSEEHTSELQSQSNLVCRLLLEKKKKNTI